MEVFAIGRLWGGAGRQKAQRRLTVRGRSGHKERIAGREEGVGREGGRRHGLSLKEKSEKYCLLTVKKVD
jgi:hypothetical protein